MYMTENVLLSPVGHRISFTDLLKSHTLALSFDASSNISRLSGSPNRIFLIAVDDAGCASFINLHRCVVLHRISFKSPVSVVKFSPDGTLIAVRIGKIWKSPGFKKEFFSFELVWTLADCAGAITSFDWSSDSEHLYLLAGSKDLMVRLFCLDKLKGAGKPFLFLGHREPIVGAFFCIEKKSGDAIRVYSMSRDGAIFTRNWILMSLLRPIHPKRCNLVPGRRILAEKGRLDGQSGTPLDKAKWELVKKDFFMQAPARLTACDYHNKLDMGW